MRKDNPQLTTHGITTHNPLRVVMSRSLDLPTECNLWQIEIARTLIFTQINSNPTLQQILIDKGVEIVQLEAVTPSAVMTNLYHRGLSQILWECGGVLAANAISDGVIQKVMAFIAPKIIGGDTAPSPVGELGFKKMTEALPLEKIKIQAVEQDILIEGYL